MTSENLVKFRCRAKYIRCPDGSLRLVQVQQSNLPIFRKPGFEAILDLTVDEGQDASFQEPEELQHIFRAPHRAQVNAFDFILANFSLDTFGTLTYAPEEVEDRWSYQSVYKPLRTWLDNRVRRRGMHYVLVPERHKNGAIHMHILANGDALRLVRARSPYTGQALVNKGRAVFNISDWRYGFSTAERIAPSVGDRDAVAKYIFKYMGKQAGQKVGGRYFLHGGILARPVYMYGDDPREFMPEASTSNASF